MKILLLNGPNLNLLGIREPEKYGTRTFESFFEEVRSQHTEIDFEYFQSNTEGILIDKIHEVGFSYDGIVFNAGAYTHTSIALADAIAGVTTPVVEVHISNTFAREEFRHTSMISSVCKGIIVGFGLESYSLAILFFKNHKTNS